MLLFLRIGRQGTNVDDLNVDGDINQYHVTGDASYINFLDGIKKKEGLFGLIAIYEICRHSKISFIYEYLKSTKGNVNKKTHQFYISIAYNY